MDKSGKCHSGYIESHLHIITMLMNQHHKNNSFIVFKTSATPQNK